MEEMVNQLECLQEESIKMQDACVRLQNRIVVMYGRVGAVWQEAAGQTWASGSEEDDCEREAESSLTLKQVEGTGDGKQ